MKRRISLQGINMVAIFVMFMVCVACQNDTLSPIESSEGTLNFYATLTDNWRDGNRARSVGEIQHYCHQIDSMDLWIHTSIKEAIDSTTSQTSTRASQKTSFANGERMGVYAYYSDALFMDNLEVTLGTSGWSYSPTNYWPNTGSIDFYAYFPYASPNENGVSLNDDKTAPAITYVVPLDVEKQVDLLAASKKNWTKSSDAGNVPFAFSHIMTAIQFKCNVEKSTLGTIKSVSLKGVYNGGTYTLKTGEWNVSKQTSDYSQEVSTEITEEVKQAGGRIDITNTSKLFMMIPQTLPENATIEILFEFPDGIQTTLSTKLKDITPSWGKGQMITYVISSSPEEWIYVFEVTENITLPYGSITDDYNVKSYRYLAHDNTRQEPVPWSAEELGEGQYASTFTNTGTGSVNATTYTLSMVRPEVSTNHPGDQTLRENSSKGSEEAPYDLSTDGGTSTQTTANCYIVNAAGTYKLPLVYGNAIKNGNPNSKAYTKFYDYKDNPITEAYINNVADATLVWSDAFYMIRNVKLSDDKKYLIFTINQDFIQQANAVLAARDADGKIMWSWHIWVTEHDLEAVHTLDDFSDTNIKYQMMPYNIGWIDPKQVSYKERTVNFKFTQDQSHYEAPMVVKQEGTNLPYTDGGSVYYQWGRKDPMISLKNRELSGKDDYRPHEVGQAGYGYRYEGGSTVSLGKAIQNPNIYYSPNASPRSWFNSQPKYYLWNSDHQDGNSNLTTSTKTIYDPSPKGFKVPPRRAFSIFIADETNDVINGSQNEYTYTVYPQKGQKGEKIILTATGQRSDREGLGNGGGSLWAMYGVYYWSCYAGLTNEYFAYSLCIRKDGKDVGANKANEVSSQFAGAQSMARPVRCIKE